MLVVWQSFSLLIVRAIYNVRSQICIIATWSLVVVFINKGSCWQSYCLSIKRAAARYLNHKDSYKHEISIFSDLSPQKSTERSSFFLQNACRFVKWIDVEINLPNGGYQPLLLIISLHISNLKSIFKQIPVYKNTFDQRVIGSHSKI